MKRSTSLKRTGFTRTRVNLTEIQALDRAREHLTPAKLTTTARMDRCDGMTQPIPKENPARSEQYRRLVALYPCKACGIAGYSQAAHINRGAKGMGMKADDRDTAPLCADRPGIVGCHSRFDRYELFPADIAERVMQAWIADTQRQIEAAGLWPANLPKP